jgi:hypothetical protein
LFLGCNGYVTCSVLGCKDPGAPHDLLQGQQASLDGELQEFGNRLAASQRPLPPDAAKLLNEHAFELYGDGQQASREQERERQPSAWSEFGDGHDYSRTGRHDPLNCRPCLRQERDALREEIARLKGEQR